MTTLTLLRHAKSRWDKSELADFDRPLAPRGIEAAPAMGRFMQSRAIVPKLVLCSPARRARQTLDLVLPFLSPRPEVKVEADLYPAAPEDMLGVIHAIPDVYDHVMLVAHNPGLQTLAQDLTGPGTNALVADLADKFPTAALAVLEFNGSWQQIGPAKGELRLFMAPKRLSAESGARQDGP